MLPHVQPIIRNLWYLEKKIKIKNKKKKKKETICRHSLSAN